MEHLIELKDVYKIYHMGDEDVHALDGVSLTIDKGEFVAIVGQSGSGKSTAMNIIGCLDVPTSGTYHLGGVDVSTMDDDQQAEIRNKMLGFIFQQYNLIPKLNVLENVELPLLYAGCQRRGAEGAGHGRLWSRVGLADKQQEPAQPALRRPAAAGVHRPGAGGQPVGDPGRRAHRRPGLPHRPGGAGLPPEAERRRGIPWCSSPTTTPSPSRPSASSAFRTDRSSMTAMPSDPKAVVQPEEDAARLDGEADA